MNETPQNVDVQKLMEGTQHRLNKMREEIRKVIIGQDDVVELVMIALLAGGHVLIEGVPGLGKTLLVRALARTFEGEHHRIQFTPDLMPSDVIGHVLYDMQQGKFKVRQGPIFTNILLADEINRAPAKTQAALLEAMQEYQVTLEGKTRTLPTPFMCLATQNPVEQEGTYPLPEAQLDRFLLKIHINYPTEQNEVAIAQAVIGDKLGDTFDLSRVEKVTSPNEILIMRQALTKIQIDERVVQYAVALVRATREWSGVAVGAGPRGPIALLRAARANALMAGRDFVIPDDVKYIFVPAMRHRLTLTPDMEIEGRNSDMVLVDILNHVKAPRL